jgi:hypothetical protein
MSLFEFDHPALSGASFSDERGDRVDTPPSDAKLEV